MRTSEPLSVTDLSGKMRIQIFPPFLTDLVIARRDASICRLVIQALVCAFSPKDPKANSVLLVAIPLERPPRSRIIFLYFTLLGINILFFFRFYFFFFFFFKKNFFF